MPVPNMRDANLKLSLVLPSGAVTTTVAAGLDIGPVTAQGQFVNANNGELLLEAPALTTTQLPNAATVVYDLISSASANMSSPTVIDSAMLTQTGAGGTGASATTKRVKLPTDIANRYVGFRATGVAATLAATASATMTYVV
jgi:hypothetical protein